MPVFPQARSRNPVHKRFFAMFSTVLVLGLLLSLAQPLGVSARSSGALQNIPSGDTPPGPDWYHLPGFYKSASKELISYGEEMTYTIHLEIGWTASLLVDVTDPLPVGLDYVPGSANHDGVYNPTTRVVSWSKVALNTGAPVNLTFKVQDTAQVTQPTPTVNIATIMVMDYAIQRQAWVTLMPSPVPGPDLRASFKSAWPRMLAPGDVVTYTIHLLNFGTASATVQVSDPVPTPLVYVPGSASSGGVYDASTHTVSWSGVEVPPMKPVLLTFAASAPNAIPSSARPIEITNTATITSGSLSFQRSAEVLLALPHASPLEGSFKAADRNVVAPGQVFTYTIDLHNSSAIPVTATVSDALPVQVEYVPGSASDGGSYDAGSRTLSWSNISVPEASPVLLTFAVQAESPVVTPTRVVNTAAISSGGVTLKRSAQVWLVAKPGGDHTPPVVHSFTIGDRDVYTSPQVTLSISATDNVKVSWMFLKEWDLATTPYPHWQEVKSSGWIPFQAEYPWTLAQQSGTHFMGVWVADSSLNRSHLTRNALDFASLLLPNTHVDRGGIIPYLVYYPAGVQVTAVLKTLSGNADLLVWFPRNLFSPDLSNPTPGSMVQTITFTTRTAGAYLFLVYGVKASDFDLSITPGGGPRAWYDPDATTAASADSSTLSQASSADGFTYNPVLPESGLDPMNVAVEPSGPFYNVFLPAVSR
jgi:uncharacterized repeat protein (TIGR01451 family)